MVVLGAQPWSGYETVNAGDTIIVLELSLRQWQVCNMKRTSNNTFCNISILAEAAVVGSNVTFTMCLKCYIYNLIGAPGRARASHGGGLWDKVL
jgi:hypothetical protein